MPGLVAEITPVVDPELPYSNTVSGMVNKLRHTGEPFSVDLADALETLQNTVDHIQGTLRQNAPLLTDMTVVDENGDLVGKIGQIPSEDGTTSYGAYFVELYVGDAVGNRNPADAPFYANEEGRVTIGNHGYLDVKDFYGRTAAWLGTKFDWLPVANASANGILIRLQVLNHTLQTGDVVMVDLVGGVPNARGVFTVTKSGPHNIDLQNSAWDGTYTGGGMVDRLLHITSVVNSGSTARITTAVDHTYETGDEVNIQGVSGATAVNGQWLIEVIDATSFELAAIVSGGGYTGGGTALRYNAGGLFRTIAIGNSFTDYNLRAFADGTLKIRNAEIILESGTGSIILDPTVPSIIVSDSATGWQVRLESGMIFVENPLDGDRAVQIDPSHIFFINNGGVPVVNLNSDGNDAELQLRNIGGALTVDLLGDTGSIIITGSLTAEGNIAADGNVNGNEYRINGVTVIDQDRDAAFNSLDLTIPLPLSEGGTGGVGAAAARTNLSVYSIAETDAAIAVAVSGLTVSSSGSHDHGGSVPAGGSHSHTIT